MLYLMRFNLYIDRVKPLQPYSLPLPMLLIVQK
jgi:hypothetical protein